jgi:hypothetical protein
MAFRAGGADFAGVKTQKWGARERALCVRQNWGHRAKSHFLPLLIRLALCTIFLAREGSGICSAPGGDGAIKWRPRSAHHRSLSPPELRLLFLERPDKDVAANRRRSPAAG